MTNEEFDGLLMAALHGPNAAAIADRILVVAAPTLADVIAGNGSETRAAVFELCVLAHLDRIKSGQDLTMAMRVASAKVATSNMVRARVRKAIKNMPNADEHATAIFLDLDGPTE
jgi:hypothetical protein